MGVQGFKHCDACGKYTSMDGDAQQDHNVEICTPCMDEYLAGENPWAEEEEEA